MDYAQFCPVAKTAEILGEKWTILILRELLYGTHRFNDFQRAIRGISPTMLTKRLKELESHGIVTKNDHDYALTPAGEDLAPLVRQFAIWGMRWTRGTVTDAELDVELLLWDIRRRIDTAFLPEAGAVIELCVNDHAEPNRWWYIVAQAEEKLEHREVGLVTDAPDRDIDLVINADLRTLIELWLGELPLQDALVLRRLVLKGRPILIRAIEQWLPLARYATYSRVARQNSL
ncbi:MAG: helix-turn-helix domain-containing protein [Pseudomonadota bacterium]